MISYDVIATAISFYEKRGYRYIETPWLVSEAISDITRPETAKQYVVTKGEKRKAFVASGEQGFLYLAAKGHLSPGKYQTVTPCMRNDLFDETHVKYFVKNELIVVADTFKGRQEEIVREVMADAQTFMEAYVDKGIRSEDVPAFRSSFNLDLTLDGVEIGSYGYRECGFLKWVYGTGVAEPRFSRLVMQNRGRRV
jgi:hypothetical protein